MYMLVHVYFMYWWTVNCELWYVLMHMYVSKFIFAYTSFLVVSMYCPYYSIVCVQPTCCPTRAPIWYKICTKGDNRNQKQTSMYSAQRIFADFAAGWGKYVTKLCTHVYTLSELLSHIWSELGSLCWIRPSFGDGTTRSNQIFHLLHIYAC